MFVLLFIEGRRVPIAATMQQSKQPSARGLIIPGTEMFIRYTREL